MNPLRFSACLTACFCLLILGPSFSFAGIGGPYGNYYLAYPGSDFLTLLVRPDGEGNSLDEARQYNGDVQDATITLNLMDANYDPVPNYPREDMWLESEDNGLVRCLGGTIADADTDQLGMTQWQNPLRGGGYSEARTVVKVNGIEPELSNGVNLNFNSPDINGDLIVNLLDVALFAQDFFAYPDFSFRSDLYRDGQINLQDMAIFMQAIGAICP